MSGDFPTPYPSYWDAGTIHVTRIDGVFASIGATGPPREGHRCTGIIAWIVHLPDGHGPSTENVTSTTYKHHYIAVSDAPRALDAMRQIDARWPPPAWIHPPEDWGLEPEDMAPLDGARL